MESASIFTRKKTSRKYPNEFERLTPNSRRELLEVMIAFKRFSKDCSKANINTQPLTKLLSTIYGQTMVTRGNLATLGGKISTAPILLNRELWSGYVNWLMEENHLTDWILLNAQSGLETKSTEPPSASFTGGA